MPTSEKSSLSKFKPTFNNLLVKPFEEADKIGRFYIPDSAKHPLNQGEILAIGPNVNNEELDTAFLIGDIIVFNMHSESRVTVDGEMLFVIPAEQVLLRAAKSDFASLQS